MYKAENLTLEHYQLDELVDLYFDFKKAYYDTDKPLITDSEFDKFEEYMELQMPNISDNVGFKDDHRTKYKHLTLLLSLGKLNSYDNADLEPLKEDYLKWVAKFPDVESFFAELKYDGNSLSGQYINGKRDKVLSRSSKEEGRDVTEKVTHIFPESIDIKGRIEIRGEALIPLDLFETNFKDAKNPRNSVAGLLAHKTSQEHLNKHIRVEAFEIRHVDELRFEENHIELLDNWGFRTKDSFERIEFDRTWESFKKVYKTMLDHRGVSNYYLDGFVIKVPEGQRIIENKKAKPDDCLAIKFPPEEAITPIENNIWEVGKTGELTPIHQLKPILLDGTVVSRATGHNLGHIIKNKLYPTAVVKISKSGDIIPQVRSVITPADESKVSYPSVCPSCGLDLYVENKIHLVCKNHTGCPAQRVKKLSAITMFGVDSFGEKTIEKLFKAGIEVIEHFFSSRFTKENLIKSGEFKEGKTLDKLINEVNNIKKVELQTIIYSLQLLNVGKSVSAEFAKEFAGWEIETPYFSMNSKAVELVKANKDRIKLFMIQLNECGIDVTFPEKPQADAITVEMTGNVPSDIAKNKKEFVNLFGGKVIHGKLNKDCNYLITDDLSSTTGKMAKVVKLEKHGVKTITYDEFYEKYK